MTEEDAATTSATPMAQADTHTNADAGTITVLYRRQRVTISLAGDINKLQEDIHAATGVPPGEQTLIQRGKKVPLRRNAANPSAPSVDTVMPAAIGLTHGSVTMLMRGRPQASSSSSASAAAALADRKRKSGDKLGKELVAPEVVALRVVDAAVAQTRTELTEGVEAARRHTSGFLDKGMTESALKKDDALARRLDERLMTLLERLDGLQAPVGDGGGGDDGDGGGRDVDTVAARWRAERRAVVQRAQGVLRDVDAFREMVQQLGKDVYGEVERRRGKH